MKNIIFQRWGGLCHKKITAKPSEQPPLPSSVTALHNQVTQQMVVTATSINQRFDTSIYPLVITAMPRQMRYTERYTTNVA
jgi:hypothetical protein